MAQLLQPQPKTKVTIQLDKPSSWGEWFKVIQFTATILLIPELVDITTSMEFASAQTNQALALDSQGKCHNIDTLVRLKGWRHTNFSPKNTRLTLLNTRLSKKEL